MDFDEISGFSLPQSRIRSTAPSSEGAKMVVTRFFNIPQRTVEIALPPTRREFYRNFLLFLTISP